MVYLSMVHMPRRHVRCWRMASGVDSCLSHCKRQDLLFTIAYMRFLVCYFLRILLCLPPSYWRDSGITVPFWCYVGAVVLNLGPHSCTGSALPTELFPQPSKRSVCLPAFSPPPLFSLCFSFFCMSVLPECMCVYNVLAWCPQMSEVVVDFPATLNHLVDARSWTQVPYKSSKCS